MIIPRLAPGGVGRGCFMPCVALRGPLYGVLWCGNIGTLPDGKDALRACKCPLRRLCVFTSPMPRWTRAQKCRLRAVRRRTSGGAMAWSIGGHEQKKTRPWIAPRAASQDFFASSQMIIRGSSKINRIIKRGSPPPQSRRRHPQ